MRSRRLLALAAVGAIIVPVIARRGNPAPTVPQRLLWAWERPVDLRNLPPGTGVAVLVQTITVSGHAHVIAPRRQPLRVDPDAYVIAVTRVEAPGEVPAQRQAIAAIADDIARTRELPAIREVQVDFDARASQRTMYRQLLHDIRAALPPHLPLSMTALASWCLDDNWLDDLPVDEAVPMLFRMGPSESWHRRELATRLSAPACRGALGVSLDEPAGVPVRRGTRVYVFNPNPWTAASVRAAVEDLPR
jgi:hypothetical protein